MRKVRVDGRTLDQIYGSHFPSFPSMLWDKLAFGNLGSTKSVSLEWNMIRLLKRKPFPRSIYTYTLLDDINLKHHKPLFQTKMGAVSHTFRNTETPENISTEKSVDLTSRPGPCTGLALDKAGALVARGPSPRLSASFAWCMKSSKFVQGVNSSAFGINHHALTPTLRIEAIRWFIPLHLMPESQLCTQDEYSGHPTCQSSCVTSETTNRKVRIWHKSHPSLSTTP